MYDLIIVGAGPAGVVAARRTAERGLSVLLLEQGRDLNKRRDLMCGWFGRGLYLLDRLEFEDPVLGKVKAIRSITSLIRRVAEHKVSVIEGNIKYCRFPDKFGLKLANYYRTKIARRAECFFNTQVIAINKAKHFEIYTNKGVFHSKKCLISTGKNSIEWIKSVCKTHNLKPMDSSVKIGVRVEIPTFRVDEALVRFGDITVSNVDDTRTNSFISEWDEVDVLSAFGHCVPNKKSHKTNFMAGVEASYDKAVKSAKIANVLTNDKIKNEKVSEYMEGNSVLEHIDAFDRLKQVFCEIDEVVPDFIAYATMYIPEIRFRGVFPVDGCMRTSVDGLYGAGECVCRVSNLIGAMASGLIAAEAILEEE